MGKGEVNPETVEKLEQIRAVVIAVITLGIAIVLGLLFFSSC